MVSKATHLHKTIITEDIYLKAKDLAKRKVFILPYSVYLFNIPRLDVFAKAYECWFSVKKIDVVIEGQEFCVITKNDGVEVKDVEFDDEGKPYAVN